MRPMPSEIACLATAKIRQRRRGAGKEKRKEKKKRLSSDNIASKESLSVVRYTLGSDALGDLTDAGDVGIDLALIEIVAANEGSQRSSSGLKHPNSR